MSEQTPVYICSTLRLARATQAVLNRQARLQQTQVWAAPQVQTLAQWLQATTTHMMLCDTLPPDALPTRTLSSFAEKLLWQQAISQCLEKHALSALFDTASLAEAAQQANQLLIDWQVPDDALNQPFLSTEARQFLRWRNVFKTLREKNDALEDASTCALQADAINNAQNILPKHMIWLGFDRLTALEKLLLETLRQKGVIVELQTPKAATPQVQQAKLDSIETECRAAVAWAQAKLQANPQAKLAIISPVMHRVRRVLQDLLDDTFYPQTLHAQLHETPRNYDFSLGQALSEQPLIRTALNLLRLSCAPQKIAQSNISALLLDVHWSTTNERDLRAQMDTRMRKTLLRNESLHSVLNLLQKYCADSQLFAHVQTMHAFQQSAAQRQHPSAWITAFNTLLQQLNWAQSRPLSSHEYQAQQAWLKVLRQFAELDTICGKLGAAEATWQLQRLAAQHMFQPETTGEVQIQLLGMLESPAEALDGVWVIGMNDLHWPPAPKPNALLPHDVQRQFGLPGADSASQQQFAQTVFARLRDCAHEVIFSFAEKEGDRELRASPLLAGLAQADFKNFASTMAERMAQPLNMEHLPDHTGPALAENLQISGGTRLLEAQAICPAWAFYQYRLGARKLEDPIDGLDNMTRGNLVHAALQHFWQANPDAQVLQQPVLAEKISAAVQAALDPLQASSIYLQAMLRIEQSRLQQLLTSWLALEAQRMPFTVQACEKEVSFSLQGLRITCRIDRIDAIAEGLVMIDYKTGRMPEVAAWADARITEPQLPLYASIAMQNEQVVAACFARVNSEECKFGGASAVDFGAGIKPIAELSDKNKLKQFGDFDALLAHWQSSLNMLAQEVVEGVADVRFNDENDLAYCDVKPLLRLPERDWQFENLHLLNLPT